MSLWAWRKTAYVLEGGRIRYRGTAQALKEDPELLRSAYLFAAATSRSSRPAKDDAEQDAGASRWTRSSASPVRSPAAR